MEYERKELEDQTHVGVKIVCRLKNIGQQEDVLNEEEMLRWLASPNMSENGRSVGQLKRDLCGRRRDNMRIFHVKSTFVPCACGCLAALRLFSL